MDSSPVLRQQNQNRAQGDHMRTRNDHKKFPAAPKTSQHLPVRHLSKQDNENVDPENTGNHQKAPVRPATSRLPVLAKSLRLQAPSNFSQSHKKWEESPLVGKAKRKKPCTKPVPFNFSQPRSTKSSSAQHVTPLQVASSKTGSQSENTLPTAHPKTKSTTEKLATPNTNNAKLNVDFAAHLSSSQTLGRRTPRTEQSQGRQPSTDVSSASRGAKRVPKPTADAFRGSEQPDYPSISVTRSVGVSNVVPSNQNGVTALAQPASTAEDCLKNMDLLSLKDPSKTHHASRIKHPDLSKGSPAHREVFQSDHAALLSILNNEPIGVTASESTTPHSKQPYNYKAQRVSVMKSQQKTAQLTGAAKSVAFSPDPAALHSILQNEGVKVGGTLGATPRNSVCPPGRGPSVYTAQRVPVTKRRAETLGGPVAMALRETEAMKWTPQRVPDTRRPPMSAMSSMHKRLLSSHRTPYGGSPRFKGLRNNNNTEQQPQQEEVVQRLFNDQEEDQSTNGTDGLTRTQAEAPSQASTTESRQEGVVNDDDDDDGKPERKEHTSTGGQPFLQAPHRESVIFFSAGKHLIRAPCFPKQESSAHVDQPGPVSTGQTTELPEHTERPSAPHPMPRLNFPVLNQPKDTFIHNTCGLSSAAALLRKRLPPLEELRLDEEVASYMSAPAPPGFQPLRPRCGNPLASILTFHEATRFVPISCDPSVDDTSLCSSPLRQR